MTMPYEPPSAPPMAGQDYILVDEYSQRPRQPNPDALDVTSHPAYAVGYGHGWEDAPRTVVDRPIWRRIVALMVATFLAGVLIGRLIVPVQAAPRSGQTTERFDLSPLASAALSGAPRSPSADPPRPVQGAPLSTAAVSQHGPSPVTRTGVASWFDAGPGLYAATRSWRWGDRPYQVTVRAGGRSVSVVVRDRCGCPGGRLIDLSPEAFRRLAPLSLGLVRVSVEGLR